MTQARRIGLAVLTLPIGLVALLVGVWAVSGSHRLEVEPMPVPVDGDAVAAILSAAVKHRTISARAGAPDPAAEQAIRDLHVLLRASFPRVHDTLVAEAITGGTVMFTWPGSEAGLPPGLLLAHQDVVPVEQLDAWTHPPFAGVVADGHVYGRGTLDDKQNVVAQLAAIEHLIGQGFRPRRTLMLAFGHDEEVGGTGAAQVARRMRDRGSRFAFVIDEGGVVTDGVLDGIDAPVAVIGISEKGYASVEIVATGTGGHSSMPPPHTAAGRVAAAVVALEANPMPARLAGPTAQMLDHIGPEMAFPQSLVMANRWLFGPLVVRMMSRKPNTNATLRTTTAATQLQGSIKDNVLPQTARAVVNFRIAPGDTTETVLQHVRDTVGPDLEVKLLGGLGSDPSPVSPTEGEVWDALQTAILQTWPDAVVAPYLTIGATDARHFTGLSEHVYRFSPTRLTSDDLARIHGNDERISIVNLEHGVGFYVRLITHLDAP